MPQKTLLVALALVGICILLMGWRRRTPVVRGVGVVCLLIASVLLLRGHLVEDLSIPPQKKPYYLSVLAIFKDEGMNMRVWVDHYLWMGADHLFLIDNGSTDDSVEILAPYVDRGVVTVFTMPEKWKQVEHYKRVYADHVRNKSKWVLVADLDEFFYVHNSTIRDTLPAYEKHDVILSQWRMFGSDGHVKHPKDIRTAIVRRKPPLHQNTKYIFQSDAIAPDQLWIHYPINNDTSKTVNASDVFRLNHYPIQSEEFFYKVKMRRGDVSTSTSEGVRNEEYFRSYNAGTTLVDTDLRDMLT